MAYSALKTGIELKTSQYKRFIYNSWGEFVEAATNRKLAQSAISQGKDPSSRKRDYSDNGWSGTKDFETAVKLANEGWPEGSVKAAELSEAMFDKVSSIVERRNLQFDVEGSDYDMGLYLKGEPECWTRYETTMEDGDAGRHLKLIFNTTTSGGVSTEVMQAKGATVAALVQLLEFSGNRVEVWMVSPNADEFIWEVLVKAADQPLDIDRLMYALGNPSCFRRLFFSLYEENEEFMQKYARGYGRCCDAPTDLRGDIYIGDSYLYAREWTNPETAKAYIIEQLQKAGVKLSAK